MTHAAEYQVLDLGEAETGTRWEARLGPTKDPALKTHTSLVPFGELTATEQLKDTLLIAIVQALAPPLEL